MKERRPVLPPAYFLGAVALMVALDMLLPVRRLLEGWWRLVGVPPLVLGVALNVAASRLFGARDTTVKAFEASRALVVSGPYRWSRNPMYVGMVLMLGGLALALGSLAPWAVVTLFPRVVSARFIRAEERLLEETFGEDYRDYRRRVRRWL